MRWIAPLVLCLFMLVGCSVGFRKPLSKEPVVATIRVHYQKGLSHKLETKKNFQHALYLLSEELNIRFLIIEEKEFEFQAPEFVEGAPIPLIQELNVMMKGMACGANHIPDGAATLCIFEGTITPDLGKDNGIVLGAQSGPIIILSNLESDIGFINVTRHEIGHLLGAPHTDPDGNDLMRPGLGEEGLTKLLPFDEGSVDAIREKLGIE